jgi:hypothetical protein
MSDKHNDKWTAFALSLAVPGAGQLWAGRLSCLAYFAVAAGLIAATSRASAAGAALGGAAFAFLGLCSAEHAKRCVEVERRSGCSRGVPARSRVLDRSRGLRGIALRIELDVDRPPAAVWACVADFAHFVTIDPFHSRIVVLGPELKPGVELALEHRAFGIRFFRFGRLLKWREGRGYTFSDVSGVRGSRGFFPHVFVFAVEPGGHGSTRLSVTIRGRWTARHLPRWVGRWWFRFVCHEHARLLRAALT